HAAKFVARGPGIGGCWRLVFLEVTPGNLDVGIVAFADVAGDVEVVARDIGCGVEKFDEVFAADDGANHLARGNGNGGERRGTSFGKGLERSAGGDEFRSVVWQRE